MGCTNQLEENHEMVFFMAQLSREKGNSLGHCYFKSLKREEISTDAQISRDFRVPGRRGCLVGRTMSSSELIKVRSL
jgi:hypothetical protein